MKKLLETRIGNLLLKNPVMTASGTFGYGDELQEILPLHKLGAIVTKSLSLKPKYGNPAPRLFETPSGLLNSIGLENIGLEAFLNKKWHSLKNLGTVIIVSIFGETEDEYETIAYELNKEGVSNIELNLSCPNTEKGGMEFGMEPEIAGSITKRVKKLFPGWVSVKLSPNFTDIIKVLKKVEAGGADAVVLINSIMGMAIDTENISFRIRRGVGGLSGPAIHPISLYITYKAYKEIKIPIIGVGGIKDTESALSYIIAGASAIQVGTYNFIDPFICIKIIKGIEDYLKRKNLTLKETVGIIHKIPFS